MQRTLRRVAGLLLATALVTGACGGGDNGGAEGDGGGTPTEDTGLGY